jgi:hypothetical protein
MKIIPIQGLKIDDIIIIPVRVYKLSELLKAFEGKEIEKQEDTVYIDKFTFVNRNNLSIIIKNEIEEDNILNKFKDTKTFVAIDIRPNKFTEFYDLRVSLSMIYIAYRMKLERKNEFFKQILTTHGYFTENYIISTRWDIKIGTKPIDENDFDGSLPVYYTMDDMPDSWKMIHRGREYLDINTDISNEIKKLYAGIIKRNEMAAKLRAALNLLYTTLNFNNLDVIIPIYATILETLLLNKNEDNQRRKVSVRSACLIKDNANYKAKEYIANWIYHFYEYRNSIVHDGKSYVELQIDESVTFDNTISLIQHIIFNIIKIIVTKEIDCIKDITDIVDINGKNDNLTNNFDYITKKLIMYYEE